MLAVDLPDVIKPYARKMVISCSVIRKGGLSLGGSHG